MEDNEEAEGTWDCRCGKQDVIDYTAQYLVDYETGKWGWTVSVMVQNHSRCNSDGILEANAIADFLEERTIAPIDGEEDNDE